jgi:hypothetical protein
MKPIVTHSGKQMLLKVPTAHAPNFILQKIVLNFIAQK